MKFLDFSLLSHFGVRCLILLIILIKFLKKNVAQNSVNCTERPPSFLLIKRVKLWQNCFSNAAQKGGSLGPPNSNSQI